MESAITTHLAPLRGAATLLTVFAAIALVLASVGIYGVLAYTVAQRRRDFGIRMALGAPARALVSVVARGMGVPVAAGAVVGLVMATMLGRTVSDLTFGVEPTDPVSLAAAVSILVLAAAVAMLGPARRATRTDPMEVMRAE
jgi:putative ABC transport system permease protein